MPPHIYLAGPTVFEPDPEAIFTRMKEICARFSLCGVSPMDNQVGLEAVPPGRELAEQIVRADIALMQTLDAGLFCLDPVRRGPEMDAGTAFEVGYMAALGKPLMGWTRDGRDYPEKVAVHFDFSLSTTAPNAKGAMSGTLRDPDGMLVHSQGCVQNAMVHIGIQLAGGAIYANGDWEVAFSQAAEALARRLSG